MRRVKTVTIGADGGRDASKVYVIREMDAAQAEEWAMRALEAIGTSAVIPPGLRQTGMAGVAAMGLRAILGAPFSLVKPLMDEMFASCLSICRDPKHPELLYGAGTLGSPNGVAPVGAMMPDDTEEVATRLFLRNEVFELHVGFSVAAYLSQIWQEGLAALGALTENMPGTSTSAPTLEQ